MSNDEQKTLERLAALDEIRVLLTQAKIGVDDYITIYREQLGLDGVDQMLEIYDRIGEILYGRGV